MSSGSPPWARFPQVLPLLRCGSPSSTRVSSDSLNDSPSWDLSGLMGPGRGYSHVSVALGKGRKPGLLPKLRAPWVPGATGLFLSLTPEVAFSTGFLG